MTSPLPPLPTNPSLPLPCPQMTSLLDLVSSYLEARSVEHCRIDGSISWQDRQESMQRFNTNPACKVFLLSTRAGGLGINLTAADTCIIYDSGGWVYCPDVLPWYTACCAALAQPLVWWFVCVGLQRSRRSSCPAVGWSVLCQPAALIRPRLETLPCRLFACPPRLPCRLEPPPGSAGYGPLPPHRAAEARAGAAPGHGAQRGGQDAAQVRGLSACLAGLPCCFGWLRWGPGQ